MISVNGVTVSFGGWALFDDISFIVGERDRIGLVGKNGAGKTTLLKIIVGEQEPTSGSISFSGDKSIGYLPQQMKLNDGKSVFDETSTAFEEIIAIEKRIEELTSVIAERDDYHSKEYENLLHELNDANDRLTVMNGAGREAEIEKTLLGLGFSREDFQRKTTEFSGGWRMRIELAKILLIRPSVMLLDEPTNHLDIESIQWLEGYLKEYRGAVVLISHDRMFLDNVTNRTVEIMLGKTHDYRVGYSKYVELRRERREQQQAAYENQQKLIQSTEDFIERFRYKPTKSNQVQSRIKQLEKLDIIEVEEEDLSALNIKFAPAPRSGQIVVEAKDVSKSFGEKHIFSDVNMIIERGEKVALVGRNGEGKTTFARMLTGDTEITSGEIKIGHNVNIGYYAQNQDDLMEGDFTVFDTLDKVATGEIRTRLRDILGAFLFKGEDVDKKVKVLSGGERSRLAMARLMLEPYNLLILDEPTNHMDMRSKDILKNAIKEYDGTVIVVSHDREFLDGMVEKIYEFSFGKAKEHLGDITEFLERKKIDSMREIDAKSSIKESKNLKDDAPSQGKLSYEKQKEAERRIRKIRTEIADCEKNITLTEEEITHWDEKLANPLKYGIDLSDQSIFEKYNQKKQQLSSLMNKWEQLTVELDNTL